MKSCPQGLITIVRIDYESSRQEPCPFIFAMELLNSEPKRLSFIYAWNKGYHEISLQRQVYPKLKRKLKLEPGPGPVLKS